MNKNLLRCGAERVAMRAARRPQWRPRAARPPPTKVGVIQIQAALAATKEGQKAAAELEDKMAPRKKELDGKQAEIKDLQERLQKGGNTLSDSAKEDLTRNIDTKTKSLQPPPRRRAGGTGTGAAEGGEPLGQKMMQVIDKYAQAERLCVDPGREQPEHAGAVCVEHRRHHQGNYRSVRQDEFLRQYGGSGCHAGVPRRSSETGPPAGSAEARGSRG